jgi:hypothetical protein
MKKVLILFLAIFALTSCEYHTGSKLQTIPVRIDANEWNFEDSYYYAEFNMPEINKNVFDRGEVKAYLLRNGHDYNKAYKNILPYVLHLEKDGFLFTETLDFEYGVYWARIYYTISDFVYEAAPPAMDFDIVITTPQN